MKVYVLQSWCTDNDPQEEGIIAGVFGTEEKAKAYAYRSYSEWFDEMTADETPESLVGTTKLASLDWERNQFQFHCIDPTVEEGFMIISEIEVQ